MRNAARAVYSALVVAGTCGILGAATRASAQRSNPEVGRAASPPPSPSPLTTPYPGATVTIDPRWYGIQPLYERPFHRRLPPVAPPVLYYPPSGYQYAPSYPSYMPYYPQYGGVNDVNGRPLASYFESPSRTSPGAPLGDPDLRGSPYVVTDGGSMLVDFGNGDRRRVAACAVVAGEQTPDGEPRTVFYTPPADGVILRTGAHGRVLGAPGAGARACYAVDQYGRMVLAY